MERILVGINGSGPSFKFKAVDFAADLAAKYNAELIRLAVVPPPSPEADAAVEEMPFDEAVPTSDFY